MLLLSEKSPTLNWSSVKTNHKHTLSLSLCDCLTLLHSFFSLSLTHTRTHTHTLLLALQSCTGCILDSYELFSLCPAFLLQQITKTCTVTFIILHRPPRPPINTNRTRQRDTEEVHLYLLRTSGLRKIKDVWCFIFSLWLSWTSVSST